MLIGEWFAHLYLEAKLIPMYSMLLSTICYSDLDSKRNILVSSTSLGEHKPLVNKTIPAVTWWVCVFLVQLATRGPILIHVYIEVRNCGNWQSADKLSAFNIPRIIRNLWYCHFGQETNIYLIYREVLESDINQTNDVRSWIGTGSWSRASSDSISKTFALWLLHIFLKI